METGAVAAASEADSSRPGRLGPAEREAAVRRLGAEKFDVLVVGGGATGAGAALDAAGRGLSVALVDATDWAAGTSSNSSKLIHGGLRYLEQANFRLVREALLERRILLERVAPHLVRRVPFLFPLHHRVWDRSYIGAGVLLYDALAGRHSAVPHHSHLSRRACLKLAPGLRDDALVGGIRYFDAQVDDARLTLELVRTAASLEAACVSRAPVESFLKDGERVVGAIVMDELRGRKIEVRSRVVINATGVWTTAIESLAGVAAPLQVRQSKGVHIVVPKERFDSAAAVIFRTDQSVLLILPWGSRWIIGTTDTAWNLAGEHPTAGRHDIDYLLTQANRVLRSALTHEDVVGVFAGLRPLLAAGGGSTARLSREHVVRRSLPGFFSVAGGKLTTYRVMARDAVDAAVADLDHPIARSRTSSLPLLGAVGLPSAMSRAAGHAAAGLVSETQLRHLYTRFGALIMELLDLMLVNPELARPIRGAEQYLCAEAHHAASHEGALRLEDVLRRRTRIAIEVRDRGLRAADAVAEVIGGVLGWDRDRMRREVEEYGRQVRAEIRANGQLGDEAAYAAEVAQSA